MGIPDFAQRWATETGWPKKVAILRQPFSVVLGASWVLRFAIALSLNLLTFDAGSDSGAASGHDLQCRPWSSVRPDLAQLC
jgi:hypothetical protein